MEISDYFILEVLIDGGSSVNIMTYDTMQKLGLTHLEPIPLCRVEREMRENQEEIACHFS